MSKARRQRKRTNSPGYTTPEGLTNDPATLEILRRMVTRDSFSNPMARQGYGTPNISEGTEYPLTRLTNNYQLLNSLYRNHWVIRNVVDTIPEDMTRNWIKIRSELPPEDIDKINRVWTKRRFKQHILHGLKWGRLYGGALGVMLIEGHEDMLEEPLNLDDVMPGTFKNLFVIDRWTGCYPSEELVDDLNSVEFGLPKYYEVTFDDGSTQRVHYTRVIRFVGRELPYWEKMAEVYWGASEVEIVFDELKKRDNVSSNILQLTFMANLRFMKVNGIDAVMSLMDTSAQNDLYNVYESQNWLMSNASMQILGDKDEFQQFQYSFAGINDIYQSFMMDLSGATKIPVTKLFGRSPAGMNATGESDMQNYYETVMQAQEAILAPVLDKILPVICMSELGHVPDDLDYDFEPINQPDDQEVADLVEKKTNAIIALYNAGLISQRSGMKELQQMSESTGMFTNITDEDIENADDSTSQGEVIPPDAFSSINPMGTQETNRTGVPQRNSTGDAKTFKFTDWFRRSKRDY
ncbi:phage portal protein [Alicyclobacillus suci]|uniref:phage portal protein n=1 Tax=Alicyclobacillus suci TaxID=2816080 RepID=UPI001A8D7DE6|nr:DUF1073 domain-containing protein [Alicyclobacillus suci]